MFGWIGENFPVTSGIALLVVATHVPPSELDLPLYPCAICTWGFFQNCLLALWFRFDDNNALGSNLGDHNTSLVDPRKSRSYFVAACS